MELPAFAPRRSCDVAGPRSCQVATEQNCSAVGAARPRTAARQALVIAPRAWSRHRRLLVNMQEVLRTRAGGLSAELRGDVARGLPTADDAA